MCKYGSRDCKLLFGIREEHADKDVKAIVFRISSPGGSDTASEQILASVRAAWRGQELEGFGRRGGQACRDKLAGLTKLSHGFDEALNRTPFRHAPYVGDSAFATSLSALSSVRKSPSPRHTGMALRWTSE